jgi:4-amino-4-deoxy-L-arabinose transferase-like glycosyltransferase
MVNVHCKAELEKIDQHVRGRLLKFLRIDVVGPVAIFAVALLIGTYNVTSSGPLWSDAPRYANGAAMIHDWLLSGDLFHPYEFAKKSYCQYPAFNLPFHPPVYPGFLGLFFLATGGVSYISARVFIALCLGISGCLFFAILKRLGGSRGISLVCTLLLLTLPEVAHWSRDTMSEIPALLFILAGSYVFLTWLQTTRPLHCWVAFGLSEMAFLSRVTTAGVLPAWFLFTIVSGKSRRLLSRHVILAAVLYLSVNIAWTVFVTGFSRYETIENTIYTRVERFSWDNVSFYPTHLPAMVGWGTLIAGLGGAIYASWLVKQGKRFSLGPFWLSWFFSYYCFQFLISAHEQRYFLLAVPSFVGLIACLFSRDGIRMVRQWLAPGLLGLALVTNVTQLGQLPRGVVGYDAVARQLAMLEKSGNVLWATPEGTGLIFRYRARKPKVQRLMLRADRHLAIRLSKDAGVKPQMLAHTVAEVLDIIRHGRVRYLVTYSSNDPLGDISPDDTRLAHDVARSLPKSFALIGKFPLLIEFEKPGRSGQVFLWEFLEELPDGPSEILAIIPTADLKLQCLSEESS